MGAKKKFFVLVIIVAVQLLLTVLFVLSFSTPQTREIETVGLSAGPLFFMMAGNAILLFSWLAFSTKCPRCKQYAGWYVMKHCKQSEFTEKIKTALFERCLSCGYEYTDKDEPEKETEKETWGRS